MMELSKIVINPKEPDRIYFYFLSTPKEKDLLKQNVAEIQVVLESALQRKIDFLEVCSGELRGKYHHVINFRYVSGRTQAIIEIAKEHALKLGMKVNKGNRNQSHCSI